MSMQYEEHCQLGFGNNSAFDDLYFGQDQSNDNNYDDQNMRKYADEDYGQKENNYLQQNQDLHHLYSNAALKMNFDKKVKFADQLSFKLDHPQLFQSEEPIPIEFKNNSKPGLPKQKGKVKKGNKKKQSNLFVPPYLRKIPQSAQKKQQQQTDSDWNMDNRASKYFDINIDPKAKKQEQKEEQERKRLMRNQSAHKASIVVDKSHEEGKLEVGFLKSNGQVGSKFEIYKDIDTLYDQKPQNYAATGYSIKKTMKQLSPTKKKLVSATAEIKQKMAGYGGSGSKDITIAKSDIEYDHKTQKSMIGLGNQNQGYQYKSGEFLAQTGEVDLKMQHLISQTLLSKETMIKALEDELLQEKHRRDQMSQQFKQQLQEFEQDKDAIHKIRSASNNMERNQGSKTQNSQRQEQRMEDELDMVPTKEKLTVRTNQSARSTNTAKKSSQPTYRVDRVKSSIPKALNSQPQKKQIQSTKYLDQLQKQEIQRAVQLQDEEIIQQEVLKKLRDNPNEHLYDLQNEVALLNRKVEPLLKRVEQAAQNISNSNNNTQKRNLPGGLSMISKMSGRLINFYSDDLAELLLDDFLLETAIELQRLEKEQLKDFSSDEAKFVAQNLLHNLVQYQNDEQHINLKYNNPAAKCKELSGAYTLSQMQREGIAQPIQFNLEQDDGDYDINSRSLIQANPSQKSLKNDKSLTSKTHSSYQNPFNKSSGVDAFSKQLADISATAPDVSYNMMTKVDSANIKQAGADAHLTSGIAISGGHNSETLNAQAKRKFKIEMNEDTLNNIALYKEKYEKFLKIHNNTANKDVWKIYDHIADDLFHELYSQAIKEVSKDMEEYIEKVIYDEFQM